MNETPPFFHGSSCALQEELGTSRLAKHIAKHYVTDGLYEEDHRLWVQAADSFFMATADANGAPQCSYKGGLPGFIRVSSPKTLRFPSYDGNGMFLSLGNIRSNPQVGMLFMDYERVRRLRINGVAEVSTEAAACAEFAGAQCVVSINILAVFENCGRYMHDRATGVHSKFCPRDGYRAPDPSWKKKREYDGIVNRNEDIKGTHDTESPVK